MYYKLRDDVLFRQYNDFGYITDNSDYGYRFLNDNHYYPGEMYVSESGAVMLSMLDRIPKHIDSIVDCLLEIFADVDYDTLKQDTTDFFQYLHEKGYINFGKTYDECQNCNNTELKSRYKTGETKFSIKTDSCSRDINANDFLRSIHIEIASKCNERCVHCYIPHEEKNSYIEPDLFFRILEEGRSLNIINVTLSGGEPLMHKDFLKFLKRSRELDLSVNVLSNLTLLTNEHVSEMMKNPLLSVQTSLYAMDPEVHDSITGFKGSFAKTMNSLQSLLSAGIPIQISCPVMKQNKDGFIDVIRWGREHQIGVVSEPVIFATYDGTCSNLANRLTLKEVAEVIDKQLPEGYAEAIREAANEKEQLSADHPICSVCRYNFCVSAEGNVFPCAGWQSNIIANLNGHTVKEIWENSEKIRDLRNITRNNFPQCVNCEDRGYCTVCMMSNSNESSNGDAFCINDFHCNVSAMLHKKVDAFYGTGCL